MINPKDIEDVLLQLNIRERNWLLYLSEESITAPRHLADVFGITLKEAREAFKKFRKLGLVTYDYTVTAEDKFSGRGYTLGLFGMAVRDVIPAIVVYNDKPKETSLWSRFKKLFQ